MKEHVAVVDTRKCFWCYSDMADYEYLVELVDSNDYEKATEIAERELTYYGCPEESPDEDYYNNVGYGQVVKEALEAEGIEAKYYFLDEGVIV